MFSTLRGVSTNGTRFNVVRSYNVRNIYKFVLVLGVTGTITQRRTQLTSFLHNSCNMQLEHLVFGFIPLPIFLHCYPDNMLFICSLIFAVLIYSLICASGFTHSNVKRKNDLRLFIKNISSLLSQKPNRVIFNSQRRWVTDALDL